MNKTYTLAIHDTGSRQRRFTPLMLSATTNTLVSRLVQGSPGTQIISIAATEWQSGWQN